MAHFLSQNWLLNRRQMLRGAGVATFSTGVEGQGLKIPEIGINQDRHSLSHHNGNPKLMNDLTTSDTFNIAQFRYLLDRLSTVTDADGPLLDTTMALFGSGMAFGHSHGNANLPLVIAGGSKLGLKHGRHLDFNAAGKDSGSLLQPRRSRQALRNPPPAGQREGSSEQPVADDGSENGRRDRHVCRQQWHAVRGGGMRKTTAPLTADASIGRNFVERSRLAPFLKGIGNHKIANTTFGSGNRLYEGSRTFPQRVIK